jgi:diguanylate cyclase (GGDEF)-like protein
MTHSVEPSANDSAPPREARAQRHVFRRYLMAVGSTLLVMVLLFVMVLLDMMEVRGFYYSALVMVFCIVLFFGLFVSGLNRRAQDPSLTGGMMACSMAGVSLAMFYVSSDARGLLLMIFLVSFIFGVLRLQARELLHTGLIASLSYGLVVGMLTLYRPQAMDFRLELMRWVVMSFVLFWFSLIGGHIAKVRKKYLDKNAELELALQKIRELATHDALTGLHNRRYLEEAMRHESSQSERSNRPFCVCLIDLDLFKSINDTYGHDAGDRVLQAFAASIMPGMRKSDHFGRYGGEEFLGILTNTSLDGAQIWAQNLRNRVERLSVDGLPDGFSFTVSIGIAQYCEAEDIEKTVTRADRCLYRAKAGGRNRVEVDWTV